MKKEKFELILEEFNLLFKGEISEIIINEFNKGEEFPNQHNACKEILKAYELDNQRFFLLEAQMQSGKTGVMTSLVRNCPKDIKNAIVITAVNENNLRDQTLSRISNANKKIKCEVYNLYGTKQLNTNKIENTLIFLDESHIGNNLKSVLHKKFIELGIFKKDNANKQLIDNNNMFISISATPFNQTFACHILGNKVKTPRYKRIELEPGNGYYGIHQMLKNRKIYNSHKMIEGKKRIKFSSAFLRDIEMEINLQEETPKWNLIRIPYMKIDSYKFKSMLNKYFGKDIEVMMWDQQTKEFNIDMLDLTPLKPTIIIIKAYARQGLTLNTQNIGFLYEHGSSTGQVDSDAQSFIGRACGYGKESHGVTVYTNLDSALSYDTNLRENKFRKSIRFSQQTKIAISNITTKIPKKFKFKGPYKFENLRKNIPHINDLYEKYGKATVRDLTTKARLKERRYEALNNSIKNKVGYFLGGKRDEYYTLWYNNITNEVFVVEKEDKKSNSVTQKENIFMRM